MPPAGFEQAIRVSEQPQTYTLDWAVTGIGATEEIPKVITLIGSQATIFYPN
jgi:hypothetical protein